MPSGECSGSDDETNMNADQVQEEEGIEERGNSGYEEEKDVKGEEREEENVQGDSNEEKKSYGNDSGSDGGRENNKDPGQLSLFEKHKVKSNPIHLIPTMSEGKVTLPLHVTESNDAMITSISDANQLLGNHEQEDLDANDSGKKIRVFGIHAVSPNECSIVNGTQAPCKELEKEGLNDDQLSNKVQHSDPGRIDAEIFDESNQRETSIRCSKQRVRSLSPGVGLQNNKRPAVLCSFFVKGWCIKGNKCTFLHQKDIDDSDKGTNGDLYGTSSKSEAGDAGLRKEAKSSRCSPLSVPTVLDAENTLSRSNIPSDKNLWANTSGIEWKPPYPDEHGTYLPRKEEIFPRSFVGKEHAPTTSECYGFPMLAFQNDPRPVFPSLPSVESMKIGNAFTDNYHFHSPLSLDSTKLDNHPKEGWSTSLPNDLERMPSVHKLSQSLCVPSLDGSLGRGQHFPRTSLNSDYRISSHGSSSRYSNFNDVFIPKETKKESPVLKDPSLVHGVGVSSSLIPGSSSPLSIREGEKEYFTSGSVSLNHSSSLYSSSLELEKVSVNLQAPSSSKAMPYSHDWEPSAPFRSFFGQAPANTSSLGGQPNLLCDSINPHGRNEPCYSSYPESAMCDAFYQNPIITPFLAEGSNIACDQLQMKSHFGSDQNANKPSTIPYLTDSSISKLNEEKSSLLVESRSSSPKGARDETGAKKAIPVSDPLQKTDIGKCKESKAMKFFHSALVDFIKELVKPSWRNGHLSKDAHKKVVKKAVEKVKSTLKAHQVPSSANAIDQYFSSSRSKLVKLVEGYVEKYSKS